RVLRRHVLFQRRHQLGPPLQAEPRQRPLQARRQGVSVQHYRPDAAMPPVHEAREREEVAVHGVEQEPASRWPRWVDGFLRRESVRVGTVALSTPRPRSYLMFSGGAEEKRWRASTARKP